MELLVANWTVRLALLGALAVGGLSLQAGFGPLDATLRAAFAAAVLTTAGRVAIGFLETPEQRLRRLRARRERVRAKKGSKKGSDRPAEAADGRTAR